MTATLTADTQVSVNQQEQEVSPFERAVELTCAEAGIEPKTARSFINSLRDNLTNTAKAGNTTWYMPTKWLNKYRDTLHAIAPHGTRSAPGSALAAVEAVVLDASQGQLGLMHRERERGGNQYCSVDVVIEIVEI